MARKRAMTQSRRWGSGTPSSPASSSTRSVRFLRPPAPRLGSNRTQTDALTTQAKNVVNYLRIIHRILAPGGVWINLGTSHHCPRATAAADTHAVDRAPTVALGEQHDERPVHRAHARRSEGPRTLHRLRDICKPLPSRTDRFLYFRS